MRTVLIISAWIVGAFVVHSVAPEWLAWIVIGGITCLIVSFMAFLSCLNYYAIDRSNEDIYDKDFTSLDDVPKPVVKIDEHC